MRPRIAMFFLAAALGLFVSVHFASAQDKQPASSPLEVMAQFSPDLGADCIGGEDITLQLHYVGAQPLRGYLVEVALTDATTGGFFLGKNIQEIRNSREPLIASDAEWTRTFCSPIPETYGGHPVAVTPKVDVLKFEDGLNWGPAALPASHRLIGTFDGMDFVAKETSQLERFVSPILPEREPLPLEDTQSQTIGPLKIESGVWRDDRGRDMLAVNVTNVSDTPIRGYLLTTSFSIPRPAIVSAASPPSNSKRTEIHRTISRPARPGLPIPGSSRICPTALSPVTKSIWTWLFLLMAPHSARRGLRSHTKLWACSAASTQQISWAGRLLRVNRSNNCC